MTTNARFTKVNGDWAIKADADAITEALTTGNPIIVRTAAGDHVAALLNDRIDDTTATIYDQWRLRYPNTTIRHQTTLHDDDYVRINDTSRGTKRWIHKDDDGDWVITYK